MLCSGTTSPCSAPLPASSGPVLPGSRPLNSPVGRLRDVWRRTDREACGRPAFRSSGGPARTPRGVVPIILIMAGATAAVGFLPGYVVIGILAPVTLIMLRAAQGLAAGGELGVAGVLIFERAASSRRGQLSSLHTATLALGLGFGMAVASLLLVIERSNPSDSGWWRLAFLLALPLGSGWRVGSPPGQRDRPVPRSFTGWQNHQATHPSALGREPRRRCQRLRAWRPFSSVARHRPSIRSLSRH